MQNYKLEARKLTPQKAKIRRKGEISVVVTRLLK